MYHRVSSYHGHLLCYPTEDRRGTRSLGAEGICGAISRRLRMERDPRTSAVLCSLSRGGAPSRAALLLRLALAPLLHACFSHPPTIPACSLLVYGRRTPCFSAVCCRGFATVFPWGLCVLSVGSSALVRPQCRSGLTTPPAVLECGPSRASGPRCAVRRCPCTPPTSLRRRHTGREGGRCVSPCVIVSWSSTMLSHRGSEGHSQSRSRGDLRSNISSAQDGEGSENFCCAVFSLPRWSAEQGRAPPPPRLSSSSACVLFAGSGNERVEHGVRPRRVDRGGVVCPTEAKTAPFGSASWQRHHSSQHGASGYAAAFECADVRGTVDWAAHHGAATTRELQRTNCCAAQRKQKQGSATQVTDLRDGRLRDLHPRSGATRRSQHDAQDTRRRGIASVQALERTNGCVLVTQTAAQRSYRLSWADGFATCTLGLALVLRCAPTVRACGCSGEAAAPLRQAIESTWADASDALVEIRSFELAIISSTAVENLPASGSKFILFGCHG